MVNCFIEMLCIICDKMYLEIFFPECEGIRNTEEGHRLFKKAFTSLLKSLSLYIASDSRLFSLMRRKLQVVRAPFFLQKPH